MVGMQLDTRSTAGLACRLVAADNRSGPGSVLAFPVLSARVAIPVAVQFAKISKAALVGACLTAEFLPTERRNILVGLLREFLMAKFTGLYPVAT